MSHFSACHHRTLSSVTYDISIGLGVASNGRTDLTPKSGVAPIYINSSTGDDSSVTPTNPATPLATIKKAVTSFVTDGTGNHILVAQGMAYSNGFANFGEIGGFSAAYPFVVQSYDPADPTNQAKWGTATGSNRPDINIGGSAPDNANGFCQVGPSEVAHQYRAFRGLKFNGNSTTNIELKAIRGGGGGTPDYMLFENCDFAATQLSVDLADAASRGTNFIVRNCALHGQFDSAVRGDAQGIYFAFTTNATIEDNIFYNCGWQEGANYTDSYSLGGSAIYGHPFYLQDDTRNSTVRRNVFIQNSNDGGRPKGDCTYYQNLVLNHDIGISAGGGNTYDVEAPDGVNHQFSYNVILGTGLAGTDGGWGIHTSNAAPGSSAHHNVLAQNGKFAYGLMADADVDDLGVALPCYIDYTYNVLDTWGNGSSYSSFALGLSGTVDVTKIHATANNNAWDDAASGTNINIASMTRPNRYTVSTLITALGYADLATAQAAWLADPAGHGWRSGPKLGLIGYGVDVSAMPFLA